MRAAEQRLFDMIPSLHFSAKALHVVGTDQLACQFAESRIPEESGSSNATCCREVSSTESWIRQRSFLQKAAFQLRLKVWQKAARVFDVIHACFHVSFLFSPSFPVLVVP